MTEEHKSPWQIEHERMLRQKEKKEKAQERAKRARFLRGLKLTRKSDKNLHQLVIDEKTEITEESIPQQEEISFNEKKSDLLSPFSVIAPTFKKIWPILLIFLLVFLGSLYALSPISRIGSFEIKGNDMVQSGDIATASHLKTQDSIYHVLLDKRKIEAKITNSSPRIKSTNLSIAAPNHVSITVHEFKSIGYVQQKGKDYAILANGTRVSENVIPAKQLAADSLLLKDFSDAQVKQFAQAFSNLRPELQKLVRTVTLTPTQSTSDFITLQMSDGNQAKVPLSQMKEKLPYYSNIAKSVKAPMTIDMEAGIFASPTPAYNDEFSGDKPASAVPPSSAEKKNVSTSTSSSS